MILILLGIAAGIKFLPEITCCSTTEPIITDTSKTLNVLTNDSVNLFLNKNYSK